MDKIEHAVLSLPHKQQIALWVILRMLKKADDGKKFRFFSSDFAREFGEFILQEVKDDKKDYGKLVGGVLSGLSRGGIVLKLSGGRDPLWTLADDILKNSEKYLPPLARVKVYWS